MRCALLTILFAMLAWATPALAHDFGAMKVTITTGPGPACTIDAAIDLDLLPSSVPQPDLHDPGSLNAIQSRFLRSARLSVDGSPVMLTESGGGPVLGADGTLSVRAAARLPERARSLAWSHDWPVAEYYLRFTRAGEADVIAHWLSGGEAAAPVAINRAGPSSTTRDVIAEYVVLGITHIVPAGLDHVLFVLGLFFLSPRPGPLLAQISAFTVAHTQSLALAMSGLVHAPPGLVEPLIALSIVFIAVENLRRASLGPWRVAVVFAFGLLHGLGFAGVLSELGLPPGQFLPALVSFNIGVELGQLSVVAAAFAAVGVWAGRRAWYRDLIALPASLAIAAVGLYWAVERVVA